MYIIMIIDLDVFFSMQTEKATINGAHTQPDLQKLMNIFIEKFVLCPRCRLPETALIVKKGFIFHKCSACGEKEQLDMSHKLCTFILKEATAAAALNKDEKPAKASKKSSDEKKDKKDKKAKKEKAEGEQDSSAAATASKHAGGEGGEGEDGTESEGQADEDGVKWHTDISAEAVAARRAEEEARLSTPSRGSHSTLPVRPVVSFEEDVVDAVKGQIQSIQNPEELVAQIRKLSIENAVQVVDRASLFLVSYLESSQKPTPLSSASAFLTAIRSPLAIKTLQLIGKIQDPLATRRSQVALLFSLEGVIAKQDADLRASLSKAIPLVLQALYEQDVVEEDAVLAWAAAPSSPNAASEDSDFRVKAAPFIEWLKNAEEDDEDEEEEEDEE
jgi:translation initiation factor 5